MVGTPGNHAPEAFARVDITEAAHRLAGIIRRDRPHGKSGACSFPLFLFGREAYSDH